MVVLLCAGEKKCYNFSELYSEFSYIFERTNNVEVWPVKAFLEQLWAGKVF